MAETASYTTQFAIPPGEISKMRLWPHNSDSIWSGKNTPKHSPPMNHNKTPKHPTDYWLWDFLGTIFAGACIGAAFVLFLFI
jgi:hypothetical protein